MCEPNPADRIEWAHVFADPADDLQFRAENHGESVIRLCRNRLHDVDEPCDSGSFGGRPIRHVWRRIPGVWQEGTPESHIPPEKVAGTPENLRALRLLLEGWACCGQIKTCASDRCSGDPLGRALATAEALVRYEVGKKTDV